MAVLACFHHAIQFMFSRKPIPRVKYSNIGHLWEPHSVLMRMHARCLLLKETIKGAFWLADWTCSWIVYVVFSSSFERRIVGEEEESRKWLEVFVYCNNCNYTWLSRLSKNNSLINSAVKSWELNKKKHKSQSSSALPAHQRPSTNPVCSRPFDLWSGTSTQSTEKCTGDSVETSLQTAVSLNKVTKPKFMVPREGCKLETWQYCKLRGMENTWQSLADSKPESAFQGTNLNILQAEELK